MGEHVDSFEEFLRKKTEEKETKKVDWEERKIKWLESIDVLYKDINEWLNPFIKEGLIKVETNKEITISEEYIGNYVVKRMDIYIGNDLVSLTPKGTLIIGAFGRIDMRGPNGEIILIQPEWNDWKFAKKTPKLEMWDLTEETFKVFIQKLV